MRLVALAILALAMACDPAAGDPRSRRIDPGAPVVVELFTSQGCSSCPPADRLLGELVRDGAIADRPVIALSFHVDYWNRLGWTDPFSRPAWSARQQAYADAMRDGRVYTPQLVIAGRSHVVGSRRR